MARPAKRSRQSRRTARLDFAAIEIVGGLLPPEVVTRVAAFDMPDQSEESYGILRGLKLRDEIARFYQIALAHWERLVASRLFRTFAHATTAPKASFFAAWSGAMFMYLRVDHWVPAMCRSLAAARFRQD